MCCNAGTAKPPVENKAVKSAPSRVSDSEGHAAARPSAIHLHPDLHAEHSLVGKELGESHRQPSETATDIDYRNLTRFPAEKAASFELVWPGERRGAGRGSQER